MEKRIISLKFDYCFKQLFSNAAVRKQFLSDVLGIPEGEIRSTRLLNPFLARGYRWQKQGILDILIEMNDDTRINIELQVARQKYWKKRNVFYLAKAFTDDLKSGEDYTKLGKCICISILDFNLTEDERYHSVYRLRDEEGKDWTELLEVHIIELNKKLKGEGALDDWIRLINATTEEELEMIEAGNAGMAEAVREVRRMSLGRKMRLVYDQWQKAQRDRRAIEEYERMREEERRIREKETKSKEEAVRNKEEAVRSKEKAVRSKEEAVRSKEEAVRSKEEAVRNKEEAVRSKEKAVRSKEKAVRNKEEAVRSKEEAVRNKEEAVRSKEEAVRSKEEAVKSKEEKLRSRQEKFRLKELEFRSKITKKESEITKKENEIISRERELEKRDECLAKEQERSLKSIVKLCKKSGMTAEEAIQYVAGIQQSAVEEAVDIVKSYWQD